MRRGELPGIKLADLDIRARLLLVTGKGGHQHPTTFGIISANLLDTYIRGREAMARRPRSARSIVRSRCSPHRHR
ncbi:MAG TPA: hypothetical protein VFW20_11015 [Candidatus Limnocylindrales bacterium]|nr:hypothetical protein [Candidatus Limnocylindrales bacterium]